MNTYKLTLKHDNGKITFEVKADSEKAARGIVCRSEGCPDSAIIKVKEYLQLYKVVRVFRKSGRRSVIERELTEPEAQRIVRSFPNNSRSMVTYTAHKLIPA
jgi:hypothetical protein